jgi:DMSO/TMAO reductase YedYZ heme-binding membrane subunit
VAAVRPPLNARTDLVLQGADPGQSVWHYVYIVCDLLTMVLLLVLAVTSARALLPAKR